MLYTIDHGQGFHIGEYDAPSPKDAAILAIVDLYTNDKRAVPDHLTIIEHGPTWGKGADRINGNGAVSFDDCVFVSIGGDRVSVVQYGEA